GISNETLENVIVYPNPFTDKLIVSPDNDGDLYSVTISDVLGSVHFQAQSFKNPAPVIDLSELNSGTYFLVIKMKDKYYKKLVLKM
ncbi:MAG: T9SS type A sorting domain-containing protein, partial [Bacteroidota bacterium]